MTTGPGTGGTGRRRIRAGNADRERVTAQLGTHFSEGRLDADEYSQRVEAAYQAVYLDEFEPLLADLPDLTPAAPAPAAGTAMARRGIDAPVVLVAVVALAVLAAAVLFTRGTVVFPLFLLVVLFARGGRHRHRHR